MAGDGIALSPVEYAQLLADLTAQSRPEPDYYCRGGIVDEFEQKTAQLLGKEDALVLPTGTMANYLAVEYLAGQGNRVLVPHDSHIHLDSGDAAQALGGINLIPLRPGHMPSVDDVSKTLAMYPKDKVEVPVKAMVLESPVRRQHEAAIDINELGQLVNFGKDAGMKLHLDGARLFIWSTWSGKSVQELAAGFDTVYISLYKFFNTLFGAVLAGPGEMIQRLRHHRRRNGGALAHIWPVALVADHFLDGLSKRINAGKLASEAIFSMLSKIPGISVKKVAQGTNTRLLVWQGATKESAVRLQACMKEQGILFPAYSPGDNGFWVKANETWAWKHPDEVGQAFMSALDKVK